MRICKLMVALLFATLLSACAASHPKAKPASVKAENLQTESLTTFNNNTYTHALSDPIVKKDFQNFTKTAMAASIYQKKGKPHIAARDVKKLDVLSAAMVQRIHDHYHLDKTTYKIHTYLGRNKHDSCYEYYNSLPTSSVGKDCIHFPKEFGSCKLCNNFVDKVNGRPRDNIIHFHWWSSEDTISLVDVIKLKNGDVAYIGLEFTPPQ